MKFISTSFFVFLIIISNAQQYEKVDNFIYSQGFQKEIEIKTLVETLTKPFNDELEKVRSIYVWIAYNIEYDYESYNNKTYLYNISDSLLAINVFKERKAVCSGYSALFKYMLDLLRIENKIISGYARNSLETFFVKEPNHDWNAIKIDDEWNLFDVTWARDTLNKKINDSYFQTKPEDFIYNHYPCDESWTLLEPNYSFDDFINFPVYSNLNYQNSVFEKNTKIGNLVANNDTVNIDIKIKHEYLLITKIYDLQSGELIDNMNYKIKEYDNFLKLYIPRKGKFLLSISALKQNEEIIEIYQDLIFFSIKNE